MFPTGPGRSSTGQHGSERPLSLRFILGTVTLALTAVALGIAVLLIWITTYFGQATTELGAAIESVRLAEETKSDLLVHARARTPVVQQQLEGELRRKIDLTRRHVTTPHEQQVMREALARVDRYLRATRAESPQTNRLHELAHASVDDLVSINVAQASETQDRAIRWQRLATSLGLGGAVVLVLLAAAFLWWFRSHALRPILAVAGSMERYARGDEAARADLQGPAELHDMAERFNEMAVALAARRQMQMTFLAAVAHELRNPLTCLKASLELLAPDGPLPGEVTLREIVARLRRQTTRLERILGDLIDTARIEAGKLELRLDRRDARELAGSVLDLFQATAPQHQLRLLAPPEPVILCCDPLRIEQVLSNLISNAVKYSPAGEILVRVQVRQDHAVLSVSDQGLGISADEQRNLFQPFRRGGLTRDTIPGVGMGLFVVRRIVEAHGGRIEVKSSPGRGSTFSIHLPLSIAVSSVEAFATGRLASPLQRSEPS